MVCTRISFCKHRNRIASRACAVSRADVSSSRSSLNHTIEVRKIKTNMHRKKWKIWMCFGVCACMHERVYARVRMGARVRRARELVYICLFAYVWFSVYACLHACICSRYVRNQCIPTQFPRSVRIPQAYSANGNYYQIFQWVSPSWCRTNNMSHIHAHTRTRAVGCALCPMGSCLWLIPLPLSSHYFSNGANGWIS